MQPFVYPFSFSEGEKNKIKGNLTLEEPLPYQDKSGGSGFYRPGTLELEGGSHLELVMYHNNATSAFMYLRQVPVDAQLLDIIGLGPQNLPESGSLVLPGQLCLGSDRTFLIGEAYKGLFASPPLADTITSYKQQNLAIFPIAREGLKYQVAEAIYQNFGYYCDEIVLDAHHVFDSSVPVYNRKVELTLFKDKDLDQQQRENVKVAYLADSIASGLVMREVTEKVNQRFDHLQQVEVISPLSTIRGLCRLAASESTRKIKVRVHVFDTLLNALPPDYYYSAHFNISEFHIRPDLEAEYRAWWGQDLAGHQIADTACAGYGWSEVFYSPRKQIQMINSQLESRHHLTIAEIVRRHLG
jgi:hypothetical protein